MFEELKELIAEQLDVEADKVTMEANFKDDLGADSLDIFELVMSLEDKFEVEIPTEELEKMSTVGDIMKYLQEHGIEG